MAVTSIRSAADTSAKQLAETLERLAGGDGWSRAQLTGLGPVAELERKLRTVSTKKFALCVSSGTAGLLTVARALDLGGREVVVPAYTYGATLAGLMLLGARLVFADIDPATLTLDPRAVDRVVTPRTAAILSVDIHGVPADDASLRAIADQHGCWYVSDAAQSLGASRCGRPASSLAHAAVTSFTVGKSLFAGEGGAILTDDADLYERCIWESQHPARQARELGMDLVNEFGLGARIHPFAALWGAVVFDDAFHWLASHQDRCLRIVSALNDLGMTEPIHFDEQRIRPAFHRLTAGWLHAHRPRDLSRLLEERGLRVSLGESTVDVVFRRAAFRAQYRSRYRVPARCTVAERQVRKLFCLVPNDDVRGREHIRS
jgi:dTDP-4-amino-4,6-dideoxygalactose transaminase